MTADLVPCESGDATVDVAIVGAGFAGIAMATMLARRGRESFLVIERADAVGGTWRENTYPGIACDTPAHLYSFSFRPPADWTSVYPSGQEIRRHLEQTVTDEGLASSIRIGCELLHATWHSDDSRWILATSSGAITARALVLAVGRLSEPHIPDIDGLDSFSGTVLHTSAWRPDIEIDGARIGVVGTGASAVQVAPHLAARAEELVVFCRTPPYVVPREDRRYTAAERERYLAPDVACGIRADLLRDADVAFRQRQRGHPDIDEIRARALGHLRRQIADPALRQLLTPNYEIGCKRILLSDSFYPMLSRDNAVFEPSALESVNEGKARAVSGRTYDLDLLILATGFAAARLPVAGRIVGRGGRLLSRHWSRGMTSYASTVVNGFPNMFVLDGPNAALGHNSAIYMIETQVDYVLGALDALSGSGVSALEVSAAAEAAYTAEIDERAASTVWLTGCDSWYVDPESRRLTLLWPGTARSFRKRNGTFEIAPFLVDRDPGSDEGGRW
ncbi:MAG: NAD(P)/FAD-dependent oxidoreductase [Gordonia sp. (in: high G+C Gram-positive bacteria)]